MSIHALPTNDPARRLRPMTEIHTPTPREAFELLLVGNRPA
ncbi:hypothetical protein [Streptomyces hokutonensis]